MDSTTEKELGDSATRSLMLTETPSEKTLLSYLSMLSLRSTRELDSLASGSIPTLLRMAVYLRLRAAGVTSPG